MKLFQMKWLGRRTSWRGIDDIIFCHESTRNTTKPKRKPYKNLCEPSVSFPIAYGTGVALFYLPRIHTKWHVSFCHESTRNDTKVFLPRKHTKEPRKFFVTKAHEMPRKFFATKTHEMARKPFATKAHEMARNFLPRKHTK
jgi:hypothetical protein